MESIINNYDARECCNILKIVGAEKIRDKISRNESYNNIRASWEKKKKPRPYELFSHQLNHMDIKA